VRDAPRTSPAPFRANGVVAWTTDFGLEDPYVGIVHGVVLTHAPHVRVVDLCHGVPPQDVTRAGFFLSHARPYFAAGTVHVAVVDPGVGSRRRILVAVDAGQAFLAPDNGLLAPVLGPGARVRELDVARFALPRTGNTFHGRDVFAPAAAAIAAGLDPFDASRGEDLQFQRVDLPRARVAGGEGEAEVLFADRYGNLVLSARGEDLEEPRRWSVEVRGTRVPVVDCYADVAPGDLLALLDSFGALEIAVRDGDAAARLGLARGDRVKLWRKR
jgi:S-adenosylmethionine hydrolase